MFGVPFRLTPAGPASAYQTYAITTPPGEKFWRKATCEDVDCPPFLYGWVTRLPTTAVDLIAAVRTSGRPYVEARDGAELTFTFSAGTPCFKASEHQVKVGRPDLFLVRGGDWRGNPRGTPARVHTRPEDWVEDLAAQTQAVADRLAKG